MAWLSASWEDRRTRRDLTLEVYRDARSLRDDLVRLAGRRHFALQRWLWAVADPSGYRLDDVREAYFEVVGTWNEQYWTYRSQLYLLFGEEIAFKFLDYQDDSREVPQSLHYRFVRCNAAVLASEADFGRIDSAQSLIDELNHYASEFSDELTRELLLRASNLQLLDPESRQ